MKKLLLPGLLLVAAGLHSCEDKDFYDGDSGGVPMEPGTEVPFSAGLADGQAASRTVYGEETAKDGGTVFPIYWKFTDDEKNYATLLDRIIIFSPQADKKIGEYMVKPSKAGAAGVDQGYADVVNVPASDDDKGLVLGSQTPSFYGFYPASRRNKADNADGSAGYICAELPSVQEVKCGTTTTKIGDYDTYVAEHNMENCLMVSENNIGVQPTAGKAVQLQFRPFTTVLDITLPGPKEDDEKPSFTITQIIVRSMPDASGKAQEIAGMFHYHYPTTAGAKGTVEFPTNITGTAEHEPDHILSVNVKNSDDKMGVELLPGQALNLKAFLLPVDGVTGIKVEVYASGNKMWEINLEKPGREELLSPGKIHKVTLPKVSSPGKDDYSSWMADLDDDMPVTQLSIPGTFESFSYNATGSNVQMQTIDIAAQFEAGIRAFRANVKAVTGFDGQNGICINNKKLQIVASDGTTPVGMDLGHAIHILHQEMESRGNREFCVLLLNQADIAETPDLYDPSTSNRDYYDLLKAYALYMREQGITPKDDLGPSDLQLGKLRGNVFLVGMVNANVPNSGDCTKDTSNKSLAHWWLRTPNATLTPMYNIQRWFFGRTKGDIYEPNRTSYSRSLPGDDDIGLSSWSHADGAPMLLSWTTKVSETELRVAPVSFGRVGTFQGGTVTYTSSTTDDDTGTWTRPTTTDAIPGLAWMAAMVAYDGRSEHRKDTPDGLDKVVSTGWTLAKKTNMYFDWTKLIGTNPNYATGTNVYSSWVTGGPSDPNFLWWIRNEAGYQTSSGNAVWRVLSNAYDGYSGSKVIQAYRKSQGRVFITNEIATAASSAGTTGTSSLWNGSVDKLNFFFMGNLAKCWFGTNDRQQTNTGFQIYAFPEENLPDYYTNVPLGVTFLYKVPGRDEVLDEKMTVSEDEHFPTAVKINSRNLVKLHIDHSTAMSQRKSWTIPIPTN